MPWMMLFNWRLVAIGGVAFGLTATHFRAYDAGRTSEINKHQALLAEVERAARAREHQLTAAKQQAEERYELEKVNAATANAGARAELERLRHKLAQRQTLRNTTATPRTGFDATTPSERNILGNCAQTAVEVAGDADRLAAQLTGLQDYVRTVCTATK